MQAADDTTLISITIFTAKAEYFDAFLETQLENLPSLGALSGSLAAQFYIARDERRAILVSQFRDQEHLGGFQQTEAFLAHRERLRPMLDGTQSSLYTLAYAREPQPA